MNPHLPAALALVAAVAGPPAAHALDLSMPDGYTYAGIGVGQTRYEWTNPGTPLDGARFCPPGVSACEDKPVGFKLFAGQMFNRYLGAELAYFNLGEASISVDVPGLQLTQDVSIDGLALSAVGRLPLGPLELGARAGVAASRSTREDTENGVPLARKFEKTRPEPFYGIGLGFRITDRLSLRVDWDRVRARTEFDEKFEVDLFSAGLGFRF